MPLISFLNTWIDTRKSIYKPMVELGDPTPPLNTPRTRRYYKIFQGLICFSVDTMCCANPITFSISAIIMYNVHIFYGHKKVFLNIHSVLRNFVRRFYVFRSRILCVSQSFAKTAFLGSIGK